MENDFNGYYFKHQHNGNTICFIIGRASGENFIQVIINDRVWQHSGLAGCQASRSGIHVTLPEIRGTVLYGALSPLKSDIMGPFRFLPMQCRHSVLSMGHRLTGEFIIDGKPVDMTGGLGYIEGDRGTSFPKEYLWLHCNDFTQPCSIMASVADIPFAGFHFTGCICAIVHCGREYRLATYRGVKIRCANRDKLVLTQGCYRLEVDIADGAPLPLKAPKQGSMTETIHESNGTKARFRFWKRGELLFDLSSANASFEYHFKQR